MQQPSQIVLWILVAANLCADLVAIRAAQSGVDHAGVAYFGLLSAQLSAVCIWAGLRRTVNWANWLLPVVASIAASLAFGVLEGIVTLEFLPYFGLLAALLLATLSIVRRMRFWRDRSGIRSEWRFSMAQLLAVMTLFSLLSVTLRNSTLFDNELLLVIGFLFCSVVLAVSAAMIWSCSIHWSLRSAGVLAVASACSAIFLLEGSSYTSTFALYHFLVLAIVLIVWLAWGGILPIEHSADPDGTTPSPSS
jgi:hypothetical protein